MQKLILTSFITATLTFSMRLHAVTIVSGPSFTPATNAPLAGLLQLTTDVDSRIHILVSDGTEAWERDFFDFSTTHQMPLLGFKPDRTNQIQVTVYDREGNASTAPQILTFVTAPLPSNFPRSTVLKSEPSKMEPGYLLFIVEDNFSTADSYIVIMDNSGQIVWYMPTPNPKQADDIRQLDNGDLFCEESPPVNDFREINLLGETVRTWSPPVAYPIDPHEDILTDYGTILYLSGASEVVSNFPSSAVSNAPLKTVTVADNPVVEISATDESLLQTWSPLALLDPTRITYLTYVYKSSYGVDNEHANAIVQDTNDDSLIVSLRNQNAVIKFSRSTGQLKWILAPHANWGTNWQQYLLTPVSSPFHWSYGQHGPDLTPQGTMLVYNDNNEQASLFDPPVADEDNYSSAIEYDIDETNMEVSEVWNSAWQPNQDRLFTPYVGKVQWLPQTRNVLVTFGAVTYVNGIHPNPSVPRATMVRLIEYTHDPVPEVVFDLSFFDPTNTSTTYTGYFCYRSRRIPDLYPHLSEPVDNLVVSEANQKPLLEFSADPSHSYMIQASTDLTNWTTIGPAFEVGGTGNFEFQDLNVDQYTTRFYRVVTQ